MKYKYVLFAVLSMFVAMVSKATDNQRREELDNARNEITDSILKKQDTLILINEQLALLVKEKGNNKKIEELKKTSHRVENDIKSLTIKRESSKSEIDNSGEIQSERLSFAVLIFGAILITLLLIYQTVRGDRSKNAGFNLVGIIFIGTVSVFLIPAGFNNAQITPVVGLLGTLAGYLVGANQNQSRNDSTS